MGRQQTTIKRKLMMALMGASLTMLALTCVVFINYEYFTFRTGLVRGLTTRAAIIAANSTAALAFQNEPDATEVLSALRTDPRMMAACLYDKQGRIFAKYPTGAPTGMFPATPQESGHQFAQEDCAVYVPVMQGSRRLGTVYLKSDLSAMNERFQLYGKLVLGVIVALGILAFLLSTWLQKRISAPIFNLAETTRNITEHKDYALRAQKLSHDEIGLLTDSFNDMLNQIQQRDSSLRQSEEKIRKLNTELEQRVAERTAQLETANKELEAFCYSVSHDLRAPLRSIDGFSQALLDDCSDKLDEVGKDHLDRVRTATQRMGQLIDDLLNLSRLSRGELHREPVNLSELADDVADELRRRDPRRKVDLRIAKDMNAVGDPRLLQVVIENLLGNAWKYTSKKTRPAIEVGLCRDNGHSAFFVRDNGAGFDMQYAGKLFAPFQRLHGINEFPGSGVGLATVQRIIHRHGGRVWAESEVDKGATFFFTTASDKNPEGLS